MCHSSAAVTLGAFVGPVLLLVPLGVVAYFRFDSFVALIELLPAEFVVGALGSEYVVTLEAASTFTIRFVERAPRRAVRRGRVAAVGGAQSATARSVADDSDAGPDADPSAGSGDGSDRRE